MTYPKCFAGTPLHPGRESYTLPACTFVYNKIIRKKRAKIIGLVAYMD